MPSVQVPGAVLDCDVEGAGPPVLALHGLTSSRWREAALGLDLVADLPDRTAIRYDARGHGRSTGRARPADYTWPNLADDLFAVLDRLCPDEPVHGVGPSMGTGTLLHAAIAAPERFSGLTLVIPPTAWATRPAQRVAYLDAADLVERRGVDAFVALGRLTPPPPAVDPDRPLTHPAVQEELLPSVLRGAAASDLPDPAQVARLDLPVQILSWADDPAHPVSTATRLEELLDARSTSPAVTPAEVDGWPSALAGFLDDQG